MRSMTAISVCAMGLFGRARLGAGLREATRLAGSDSLTDQRLRAPLEPGAEERYEEDQQTPWPATALEQTLQPRLLPLFWLHIPKCGSAFGTVLAHFGCGSKIPSDQVVEDWCNTDQFNEKCGAGTFLHFSAGHRPLGKDFDAGSLHHVATMFREPRQRAISGWFHHKHDCSRAANINDYITCVSALQTSMVAGGTTLDDEELAVQRVRSMGFVGLTQQWDLSVCLLHAMHGGDCLRVEFEPYRVGNHSQASAGYDTKALGLHDTGKLPDDALYNAAKEVFNNNLKKYKVSRSTCLKSICPNVAEVFRLPAELLRENAESADRKSVV